MVNYNKKFPVSPYLRSIRSKNFALSDKSKFPLNLPFLVSEPLNLEFNKRVTIIFGENGSGKSTLLESIANNAGFSLTGGSRNHRVGDQPEEELSRHLIYSWLPKVTRGLFIKAETLQSFIGDIEKIAVESDVGIYSAYGGKSLATLSHGEAFSSVFKNRFASGGLFILDEPESALSPERQCEFIKMLHESDVSGNSQFIIATHSPLIMAYPGASLLEIRPEGVREILLEESRNFKLFKTFYENAEQFMRSLLNL